MDFIKLLLTKCKATIEEWLYLTFLQITLNTGLTEDS